MNSILRIGVLWSDYTWTEELVPCNFTFNTSTDVLNSFVTEWGRANYKPKLRNDANAVWLIPLEVIER